MFFWLLFGVFGTVQGQEVDKRSIGKLSGEWRTFYLSTYNKGALKDYYALATGGYVKYEYAWRQRVKIGGALYTSFNTNVQDLTQPDATTGKISRYEVGLFNVQDLNQRLVVLPGELYVKYISKAHEVTLGRMKIFSPFINPEDGRMIPTLEQGIWYRYQPNPSYKIQLGAFNAIAPRSTDRFFSIGESVGTYPVGRNPDGTPSQYFQHTRSDYMALANLEAAPTENLKISLWDYYVDNIFHTLYLKPTLSVAAKKVQLAAEWLHQDRVGDGGNEGDSLRYFTDKRSNVMGAEAQVSLNKNTLSIGYDYILPGGRFLFPREWGREGLFSFQKRERSEGTANSHAVVLTYEHTFSWKKDQLRTITSLGRHWKPSVLSPAENKYAMPDYTHINLDLFYQSQKLPHLKPELLLLYKVGQGDYPENPNFVINKVDMLQVNLIVNYNF